MQKDCSALILAAGYSSRMGFPKFALALNSKTNFLENIINQYIKLGCSDTVVVINREGAQYLDQHPLKSFARLQFVINQHPEYEKFYSIQLGVKGIRDDVSLYIHAVDTPLVGMKVLERLYQKREDGDYIKPEYQGKSGHPILLAPQIVQDLKNEHKRELKLNEFLKAYCSSKVQVDDAHILDNINTRLEYEEFLKLMDSNE